LKLALISWRNLEQKNKYKYKTHLIMVKQTYKSKVAETGKYYLT
jgi:hypothetical protein